MANSMSSKTKVQFVEKVGESIVTVQKQLTNAAEEIKAIANKAQYAACDRVYNAVAEVNNAFAETLAADKETLVSVMEVLVKRTDVGEAFVASAKKTKSEIESIPRMAEADKIVAERDGSEVWNSSSATALEDALGVWSKARLEFIASFAESFSKIEEEEFKDSVKPIGKKNEEFTNSVVAVSNSINEALTELGVTVTKFTGQISDVSSSVKVADASSVKPNLMGADI